MTSTIGSLTQHLYVYQRERFPLLILALSLIPAILSSGAIASGSVTVLDGVLALVASVAYLFHIRVIDERRDFNHDSAHHRERPVQSGRISMQELAYADIVAVLVIVIVAGYAGPLAAVLAFTMLLYSYLAGKEFFLGDTLRSQFFLYNGVNLVQMILMQLFVYALFLDSLRLTDVLLYHFLFTTTGTLIVELIRKLKLPGEDGTGKDTYTFYLGFAHALWLYAMLLVVNLGLLYILAMELSAPLFFSSVGIGALLLYGLGSIGIHARMKSQLTNQGLQLGFLLVYGISNIALYLYILNL